MSFRDGVFSIYYLEPDHSSWGSQRTSSSCPHCSQSASRPRWCWSGSPGWSSPRCRCQTWCPGRRPRGDPSGPCPPCSGRARCPRVSQSVSGRWPAASGRTRCPCSPAPTPSPGGGGRTWCWTPAGRSTWKCLRNEDVVRQLFDGRICSTYFQWNIQQNILWIHGRMNWIPRILQQCVNKKVFFNFSFSFALLQL